MENFPPTAEARSAAASTLSMRQLMAQDVPAMCELEALVYERLPDNQKFFIILKTEDDFRTLISPPHYGVGIFKNGQLVAQMLLGIAVEGQPAKGLTDCPGGRLLRALHIDIGVVQCVLTHPDHRKQGFMTMMLKHITLTKEIALAGEVASGNEPSIRGFKHCGFELFSKDIDPSDGTGLQFYHRPISNGLAI